MQNSGFENRFIDAYGCFNSIDSKNTAEYLFYAPVFSPNDLTSLMVFPGVKATPLLSVDSEKNILPSTNITLPLALLFAVILFVFLKKILKSSIGNIFLSGFFSKSLQEADRRQIDRNTVIVNFINAVSFFSVALIFYALATRFNYYFSFLETLNIQEKFVHLTFFCCIVGSVLGFFYARSGLIAFFGNIFSSSKMVKEYQKSYKMLFLSLSPILLSVAIFIAFAPYFLMYSTSFYLLACIAACYVIFIVVSLLKFLNFTSRYSIHIFLYLCTLEILPLAVMVKFVQMVYF